MDPGYRSPLVDLFRRGEVARDLRMLAAQGALSAAAHEQLALLMLLSDDGDPGIAPVAQATLQGLPEERLRAFLARQDVPAEMREFFAGRGMGPGDVPAADATEPLLDVAEGDEEGDEVHAEAPKLLASLPIRQKVKLASKGTREQRAQLIRDPNKVVAAAVLSSPKLTSAEVEAFARMANVSEEVLRVIGTNRSWLKGYGVVLGLVKNPKTPLAISMQLLQRIAERDIKMLVVDRNVPEALRLAARKRMVQSLK
jgi:hypothetical protein